MATLSRRCHHGRIGGCALCQFSTIFNLKIDFPYPTLLHFDISVLLVRERKVVSGMAAAKPLRGVKLQASKSGDGNLGHVLAIILAVAVAFKSNALGGALLVLAALDKLAALMTHNLLFPNFLVRPFALAFMPLQTVCRCSAAAAAAAAAPHRCRLLEHCR